jgi:anti-sigma-K factor RskA
MAYSEDHIALAAEYALGTLDADERTQVETMMSEDKDFTAMVEAWEFKLGVLNQMVGSVEPPPELWNKIRTAVGLPESQPPLAVPEATVPPPAVVMPVAAEAAPAQPSTASTATQPTTNVVEFPKHVRRWRTIAATSSALAAALLAIVGLQIYQPDTLPAGLRPKPRTQVVQVPAPAAPMPAQFVAVLQRDGSSPAFILTVDGTTKNFTVRKVGATPEPGKSYELWLVSEKLQRPRSLGVIGSGDFTARPALASYDTDTVNKATFAVTVEPEGGSPTGIATGPIVFTGKLIEAVPPAAPRPGR